MMLIEETTVPDAALPVEQFKAHLRLGTGFGEDGLQEVVLKGFKRKEKKEKERNQEKEGSGTNGKS